MPAQIRTKGHLLMIIVHFQDLIATFLPQFEPYFEYLSGYVVMAI